ncbi:hypothetical protein [Legionella rowbothamii]|uniref:hypothetical protein n=1 Tax=Legionella rowbothamii TaxID=96229 RepID=UPI001056222A|nr:hypothetical protein [Legionella rowbothamii]
MFFKIIRSSQLIKEIPKSKTPGFKDINWSLTKTNPNGKKLSSSSQTIVNELENSSSCDTQEPVLKRNYP